MPSYHLQPARVTHNSIKFDESDSMSISGTAGNLFTVKPTGIELPAGTDVKIGGQTLGGGGGGGGPVTSDNVQVTGSNDNLTTKLNFLDNAINTGLSLKADVNNDNNFKNALLGGSDTKNEFDEIEATKITNTGTTNSNAYEVNGANLNFSHLAGAAAVNQIPSTVMRTDINFQKIQSSVANQTMLVIENGLQGATGSGPARLAVQKTDATKQVSDPLFVMNTFSITASANDIALEHFAGDTLSQAPITIQPANAPLPVMKIDKNDTEITNKLKILGTFGAAAHPLNKPYLLKIQGNGDGIIIEEEQFIQKPSGNNPTPADGDSVVVVESGGTQKYVKVSSLGGGGGNFIEKDVDQTTTGELTAAGFDTSANTGYKINGADLNFSDLAGSLSNTDLPAEALRTDVANQTILNSAGDAKLNLQCSSSTGTDEVALKIVRTGTSQDNDLEINVKPGETQIFNRRDITFRIDSAGGYGSTKKVFNLGGASVNFHKKLVLQNGADIQLNQTFTEPATSSSTGLKGTFGFTSDYLYVAVAANTWKRVALSTF